MVATLAGGAFHGLREAFFMLWDTLWALVAGFTLSGAVQAFVSREAMRRRLGDHGVRSVVRAAAYGAVSSSCSYAASAMARSLFALGADFVTSMVFLFASTNLVVELGIVLVVLLGWQFLAAEVVGGVIMLALLVLVGSVWLRGRLVTDARRRVEAATSAEGATVQRAPWRERIRTTAGWSDAAAYTVSDLRMLRRELLVGFVVAGYLTALVPVHVWNDLFVHGHGVWTELENAAVGPAVAVASFVCSIGNVPLAAALWSGGISFGGVVSFVFADLITFPLLLVYRKQYGTRLAVRMLVVFWAVMSAAGLVTGWLFRSTGLAPTARRAGPVSDRLALDPTTVLDVLALLLLAVLLVAHHRRQQRDGGEGYAEDPVCGMQVDLATATVSDGAGRSTVWFCSEGCRDHWRATRVSGAPSPGTSGPRP